MKFEDTQNHNSESDSDIQKLLKAAGKREEPAADIKEDVRIATLDAWQSTVKQHNYKRKLKRWMPVALAATVILSILGTYQSLTTNEKDTEPLRLATIAHSIGEYSISNINRNLEHAIFEGSVITTSSDGMLALILVDNTTIRLGHQTHITIHADNKIWLHRGHIFIGSPDLESNVAVMTSFGKITDIGTQFEVGLEGDSLWVALREGRVIVQLTNNVIEAGSEHGRGDLIIVDAQGLVSRRSIESTDARWNWVREIAPPFKLEAASVLNFLEWTASEVGLTLKFQSDAAQHYAKTTTLSGPPIEARSIEQMLPVVLRATHLDADLSNGAIEVGFRR